MPSVFSLVCLIFGVYTLNRQAIAEEQHLSHALPVEYREYSIKVRRWL